MQTIKVISLSFKNADVATRGQIQFSDEETLQFLAQFQQHTDIKSLVLLSTCNRTELYFESSQFTSQQMIEAMLSFKNVWISGHLLKVIETSEDASQYIMEVASGLQSMVVGDKQIIQQVKKAYLFSQEKGLISGVFERLFQQVFRAFKRISNETNFLKGSQSTSYLAVEHAKRLVGKQAKVLLIGAGEIAKDVVKYLTAQGFDNVVVTNRTIAKAQAITQQDENYYYLPFEHLSTYFSTFDVVISSVGVKGLIHEAYFQTAHYPKVLIDLAVPASIQIDTNSHSDIKLINIDQLAERIHENKVLSQQAIAEVNTIIEQELGQFLKWFATLPVNAFLASLKQHYKSILTEKLKQHKQDLPEGVIDSMVAALLKAPAVGLKNMAVQESVASIEQLTSIYQLQNHLN